jgi:GNAT superfamily N-acetyltransferase
MEPYSYYLSPINKHDCFEIGYVFLTTKPIDPYDSYLRFADVDPGDFFDNDDAINFFNVCGAGRLLKRWINGRLYVCPCSTSLHTAYRGQGYGKLLYKSLLKGVEKYREEIKTLPYFAHHTIADDVAETSEMAKRVYASLEREGLISFVKDSVRSPEKVMFISDGCINDKQLIKGSVYKVQRFPCDLKIEYIKTINLEDYDYYSWVEPSPEYNLYRIQRVSGGTREVP